MQFSELLENITESFAEDIIGTDEKCSPSAVIVNKNGLVKICSYLHRTEGLYFDSLSNLTAIDKPDQNKYELAYNLYSIPYNHHLCLKVTLDKEENPESLVVGTVSEIWRTADWHEREAYDLMGIYFEGHKDLRRILLPADWEGHPLRKDYAVQSYYQGIQVMSDENGGSE